MVIGLAGLRVGEIALVTAAGDDSGLAGGEDAQVIVGAVGICDADAPFAAVRLEAQGLDVAAEGDDAAGHAGVAHRVDDIGGGAALGDRAEGDFAAGGHVQLIAARAGEAAEDDLVEMEGGPLVGDLRIAGHVVAAVHEAPELDQRVDRQIQRIDAELVALLVDGLGGLDHARDLPGHGDGRAVRTVEAVDDAGLLLRVEHGLHGLDDGFAGADAGLGLGAVGGQVHHGVHGEDFFLIFGAHFAAGAERKQQAEAEQQGERPEETVLLHICILILFDRADSVRARAEERPFAHYSTEKQN